MQGPSAPRWCLRSLLIRFNIQCDGVTPCSRCRADDAICAYGKARQPDKIYYSKGYLARIIAHASASDVLKSASYVQMLERQQLQMTAGIQELYRRLRNNEAWPCSVLEDDLGPQPLTHKVLETLGVLPGQWEETGHIKNAPNTAPQSPFNVGVPNSIPQLPESSPSYRANDGWMSTSGYSPSYGANDGRMSTSEYSPSYGAIDGWMPTPESDVVSTESLQLAHMDHILPTTDDSRPLSKRRRVDLSLQLTPISSFLTFSHPDNILGMM